MGQTNNYKIKALKDVYYTNIIGETDKLALIKYKIYEVKDGILETENGKIGFAPEFINDNDYIWYKAVEIIKDTKEETNEYTRSITLEPQQIGNETLFRLTIGNSINLLTREETQDLSATLDSKSTEIFNIPF